MAPELSWRLQQSILDHSISQGEEIARVSGFEAAPVDPFTVVASDPNLYAEGADFQDAFDGRLEYIGPRFLLAYNTKYDRWPHMGDHHPKVRFTVGHELGHYFIDEHREYLRHRGAGHCSLTEFQSQVQVERQADCFSAGLLMPRYMLAPAINKVQFPTLDLVKEVAHCYRVSLTGLLVRWTQLSDFPCAVVALSQDGVKWGWVSEAFRAAGAYRVLRSSQTGSRKASEFLRTDPTLSNYREGKGSGLADQWLDFDRDHIGVDEFYAVIPYGRYMLVFIVADEDDLDNRYGDDND